MRGEGVIQVGKTTMQKERVGDFPPPPLPPTVLFLGGDSTMYARIYLSRRTFYYKQIIAIFPKVEVVRWSG